MIPKLKIAAPLVLLMALAAPSFAEIEYVSNQDGSFGSLNTTTWAFTTIATGLPVFNGMAYVGGVLYGDNGSNIYKIDTTTGATTAVGTTSLAYAQIGTQVGNSLYVGGYLSSGPSNFYLGLDNLTSGGPMNLGAMTSYTGCANLAAGMAGVGSMLYVALDETNSNGTGCSHSTVPTATNALYTANLSTGALTEVGATGLPLNEVSGMFTNNGVLYAYLQLSGHDAIYSVNTSTGAATFVANTSTQFASAADAASAGSAATPEPGTVWMGLTGLLSACWLRKRKNAQR